MCTVACAFLHSAQARLYWAAVHRAPKLSVQRSGLSWVGVNRITVRPRASAPRPSHRVACTPRTWARRSRSAARRVARSLYSRCPGAQPLATGGTLCTAPYHAGIRICSCGNRHSEGLKRRGSVEGQSASAYFQRCSIAALTTGMNRKAPLGTSVSQLIRRNRLMMCSVGMRTPVCHFWLATWASASIGSSFTYA